MEDAPNRIFMAALAIIFHCIGHATQILKDMRSPSSHQLLQQPVLPIHLLRGCGFTLHNILCTKCLPGSFSPLTGAPPAAFPPRTGAREGLWMGKRISPAPAEQTALPLKTCSNRQCPKHRLGQSSASTSLGRLTGKAWCLQEKHKKISWRAEGRRSPGMTRSSETPPFGEQEVYLCHVPWWVAMALRALRALNLQLSCKFLQCHGLGRDRCREKVERAHQGTPPTASHTACALALTQMGSYISVTQMKCFSSTAFRAVEVTEKLSCGCLSFFGTKLSLGISHGTTIDLSVPQWL